jgi:hypothetical protein
MAVVLGIHGELLEFLFHDLGAGFSLFKQFLFTNIKFFRFLIGLYDLRLRSFFISLENLVLVALLNAHDLFLMLLMLLQDQRICALPFLIVLYEIERSGCFNAKESRVQSPEREIVDADRPRGVAFVLLNNFLFESLQVGLILQGLRLFIASISRGGLILALIVKRRCLFCYVLEDIFSVTVFFEVS